MSARVVPGVRPRNEYGKLFSTRVELRREVIRFGLRLPSHARGMLLVLVHVMRDGSVVVEELRQHVPLARSPPGFPQEDALAAMLEVAEAFVFEGAGTVIGFGHRSEPAFLDAARARFRRRTGRRGCSFIRRPGAFNCRGTQQGTSRRIPWPSSRASRITLSSAIASATATVIFGTIFSRMGSGAAYTLGRPERVSTTPPT